MEGHRDKNTQTKTLTNIIGTTAKTNTKHLLYAGNLLGLGVPAPADFHDNLKDQDTDEETEGQRGVGLWQVAARATEGLCSPHALLREGSCSCLPSAAHLGWHHRSSLAPVAARPPVPAQGPSESSGGVYQQGLVGLIQVATRVLATRRCNTSSTSSSWAV